MSDTVRVSRAIAMAALADAISWEESFLAAHNGVLDPGTGCCDGDNGRCEEYKRALGLLGRYRRSMTRILAENGRSNGIGS